MEPSDLNNSLPEPFLFNGGEWSLYEDTLYKTFCETLLDGTVDFRGIPVKVKRHPEYKGKHFAFWHLISEGEKEDERTPDLRRCERLAWVAWVIQNCDANADISWWENDRWGQKHIVIWYEKENYAVVLARRNGYCLLKTAYLVAPHRTKSFQQERDAFRRNKA